MIQPQNLRAAQCISAAGLPQTVQANFPTTLNTLSDLNAVSTRMLIERAFVSITTFGLMH